MGNISVVINAFNNEDVIENALKSVKWADEIVVVDDGSTDRTLKILSEFKIQNSKFKIYHHKSVGYVEPARNFAISKATNDWVLILDTDEEIPETLAKRLQDIAEKLDQTNHIEIPRKNIIFNKWMRASMWWPDYNIRFFRKGTVKWSDKIHSKPQVEGQGIKLEENEDLAIIHHNYNSLDQYLERVLRYTKIQARELSEKGVKFNWTNLIEKPLSEFLSRFFANRGFEDGLHGLVLSLLQSYSELLVYLRLWEMEKFTEKDLNLPDLKIELSKGAQEVDYWFKHANLSKNPFKRFLQKGKNKIFG